jgi:hypothetical protein
MNFDIEISVFLDMGMSSVNCRVSLNSLFWESGAIPGSRNDMKN